MSHTNTHAKRVASYLNGKDPNVQETFWIPTPGQVMLIAGLIKQIVEAIDKCTNSDEQALRVAHRPNRFQKGMLKRITRRKLGWWRYYFGKDYEGAVKSAGKDLSTEEMRGLLDEAVTRR